MEPVRDSSKHLQLLSELLLTRPQQQSDKSGRAREWCESASPSELQDLTALAMTNHVILRAFDPLDAMLEDVGNGPIAEWAGAAMVEEHGRIEHALGFLTQICGALEDSGCPVIVIKSLDHWPDLGSDLDLYTDAEPAAVVSVMRAKFRATLAGRSWGDRLANKWNFIVPGLPELVEFHARRLGQTGEQTALTHSVSERACTMKVGPYSFRVAAPEDRIVISTLQRMYRHFYIRLCDIVDNARLLDSRKVDFEYLHSLGSGAGLWEGIATYLHIISEYVETYRRFGVPLPALVQDAAKFGASKVRFRKDFLRVPILPDSLNLYAGELKTLFFRGELRNTLRLSLLPGLATAAALEQKITGSDKGIW
ncbi:MAG: hypothetical protein WCF26_10675 [Candidatus Sulfotelmatobacter sp.]